MKKEIKKKFSAGGIVLNKKGEVVLVSQKVSWSFPKGGIKKGETELEAAMREIWEESGIEHLDLIGELGVIERSKIAIRGKGESFEMKKIAMFLFTTKQKKLKPIDSDNPEALWIKIEEVAERLTHEKDKEFFLSVMDQVKKHSKS
ncbi:NUDIX hydrolase [Candidatus Peregrinibacteria bacterium]|nr:NUDIX hydrolase [Candidatus Peregrinibacteria bacterium]